MRTIDGDYAFVIDIDELYRQDVMRVEQGLRSHEASYLGALQVKPSNPVHWTMFDQSLIRKYRVHGPTLRVLHTAMDVAVEDARDPYQLDRWVETGLFETVAWENDGVRGSVFDQFDTWEEAQAADELRDLAADLVGVSATRVVSLLLDRHPEAHRNLRTGLRSLQTAHSPEEAAQVMTSFRRFIESLANALYPPRETAKGERKLGPEQFKNRLIAFVDERLDGDEANELTSTLQLTIDRLERLLKLVNKGVHADVRTLDAHHVGISLLLLTYELLTLSPPPDGADLEPYRDGILDIARRAAGGH